MSLDADLRIAIARNEIAAHFQPQIDLASGEIVGAEALCRWNHPELGPIAPEVFIPVAESAGLIHQLGEFMVTAGARVAARWARLGRSIEVAVNVSPTQLVRLDFFARIAALIVELELDPHLLTIEITETEAIEDLPMIVERLEKMRALRFNISIDDFGTGHSSLVQAMALPANELKIDRSIVQLIDVSHGPLIVSIVELAHRQDMRVVAEGIETVAQLEQARLFGIDRGQGYLIGEPVPAATLEERLFAR